MLATSQLGGGAGVPAGQVVVGTSRNLYALKGSDLKLQWIFQTGIINDRTPAPGVVFEVNGEFFPIEGNRETGMSFEQDVTNNRFGTYVFNSLAAFESTKAKEPNRLRAYLGAGCGVGARWRFTREYRAFGIGRMPCQNLWQQCGSFK